MPVQWSAHAVLRYGERIRPALDEEHVRAELSRLLATATLQPPSWLRTEGQKAYLTLDNGAICLPLVARGG